MKRKISNHYKNYRYKRERIINRYCNGDGDVIDSFFIDRGHKDGAEIHCVTNTGLIIVYNANSGKLVTKLVAREKQIKRLYEGSGKDPPKYLLDLCRWHEGLNYNWV